MAACRVPALRHLISCQPQSLRAAYQRRWAQVHDVRFLATTQPRRVVIEKYREKLERKAREAGLNSIDDLKVAYGDKIQDLRKKDAISIPMLEPEPTKPLPFAQSNGPPPPPPAAPRPKSSTASTVKPLSEILDLPKARELPPKELNAIWRLRHASSPSSLCATIPTPTYSAMEAAARLNPQFVLPIPHEGQGAEIHFLQWMFNRESNTSTVMFTQLAEFKNRGEYAQPHTTITHHLDLAEEKGLVLMQGQVVDGRGVTPDDARWLVLCLQRFYGGWDGMGDKLKEERAAERRRLLEWFKNGDSRFSVDKLLEEAERLP